VKAFRRKKTDAQGVRFFMSAGNAGGYLLGAASAAAGLAPGAGALAALLAEAAGAVAATGAVGAGFSPLLLAQ
jgi:hypothetical protein